jgi:5-methylcytosine-specific restriction endonuclease McrA
MSYEKREWQKLYARAAWRGPCGVRLMKLRRDPMCEAPGCRRPATVVDHHHPHRGDWCLFLGGVGTPDNPFPNLVSLCKPHHDEKTATFDGGLGNPIKKVEKSAFQPVAATGEEGRLFCSSTVTKAQLDKALGTADDIAALLDGIPE